MPSRGRRHSSARGAERLRSFVVDPSSGERLPGIQGVRALSAAAILLLHIWAFSSPPGHGVAQGRLYHDIYPHLPLGVTLLFILSGFLLYRPFAAGVIRRKPVPSLGRYLRNRALRILPAYWFILFFAGFVLQATAIHGSAGLRYGALDQPGLLLLNSLFLQSFYPSTIFTGIGPAWALTDVVVFYLCLPLLVLMAHALARRSLTARARSLAALAPAVLLIAFGLSGKVVAGFLVPGAPWDTSWHAVIERSFWAHADWFALGMIVAILRVKCEDGGLRFPRWWRRASVAVLLLIALPTVRFTTPEGFTDGSFSVSVYGTSMAVVCAIFLALVVLRDRTEEGLSPLVRLLESPPIVALGVVSYSLFIWQLPLIVWMRSHGLTMGGAGGLMANVAVLGTLTFVFSAVTYRYFEFPALRRKAAVRLPAPSGTSQDAAAAPALLSSHGRHVKRNSAADLVRRREDVGEEERLVVLQTWGQLVHGGICERDADRLGLQPVDQVAEDPAASARESP